MTLEEMNKSKAEALNSQAGTMTGYDCPLCKNKGYIAVAGEFNVSTRECECMKIRRSKKFMEMSGLGNVMDMYSLDKYETKYDWQRVIKERAVKFISKADNSWFAITGNPGSGKTHICTAICAEFLDRYRQVRYMMWRSDALYLKTMILNSEEYSKKMYDLCNADVLYIDDFWKGDVTQADINLAFEIINYRYMSNGFATIISSEKTIDQILEIDEAIGSRIVQRSKGYLCKTPNVNLRF